jgi:hypothetical protein
VITAKKISKNSPMNAFQRALNIISIHGIHQLIREFIGVAIIDILGGQDETSIATFDRGFGNGCLWACSGANGAACTRPDLHPATPGDDRLVAAE